MPPQQRRPSDGVTVGEVNRNVVDLRATLEQFIAEVRVSYVRRDVYDAETKAHSTYVELLQKRVDELEDKVQANKELADAREKERVDQAAKDRRLIFTAIIAPIIVAIVTAILLANVV